MEAQALPGHEALIAQFKADGKTTGPEAAVAVLAAERAANKNVLAALTGDAPKPAPHAAAPAAKPNAAELLRAELGHPRYRCEPIALGANTDPYQPIERQRRITRSVIEVLAAAGLASAAKYTHAMNTA